MQVHRKITMRRWLLKGGLIGLGTLVVVHYLVFLASPEKSLQVVENFPYILDTPGCQIPNMQVNSYAASQVTFPAEPLDCGKPPIVESNETHVTIVKSNLLKYGATKAICCYRPFWRHVPTMSDNVSEWILDKIKYDFDIRYSPQCYPFDDSAEITHEFVEVQCEYVDEVGVKNVYKDFHGFFPKKKDFPKQVKSDDKINVLIIGLDSLSRLNMLRQMPQTYSYLTKDLGGIPMLGYNKVGLNTYPNLTPLFTGFTHKQLRDTCLPAEDAHYDACKLIFKNFQENGYVTAYMMDRASTGGYFDYYSYGLVYQPTNYFSETLFIPMEDMRAKTYQCIGSRSQIEILLNYTRKNLRTMTRLNQTFFTFSWGVTLSHDGFNDPQIADPLYFNILKDIHNEGILKNTFMIFMSDHGLRFGDFVRSFQGQLEDHLPAMLFVMPQWFRKKYPTAVKHLLSNQNRLLTTFDLHATLLDLIELQSIDSNEIRQRELNLKGEMEEKGGISLFLPIPDNRTCPDAKIPEEFCSCENLDRIGNNVEEVIKAAKFMVRHINEKKLHNDNRCILRTFDNVNSAARGPRFHLRNDSVVKYQLSFSTKPDGGLFSGMVRHFEGSGAMEVVGELSRINAYGFTSRCMTDVTLLPYCYCKNQSHLQ